MKLIKPLILILPGLSLLYLIKFSIAGLPTNVFEVLIYVLAIVSFFYSPNWRNLTKAEKWAIGLMGLTCLISLIVSPAKREALGIIKGWIVLAVLVYWMLKNALESELNVKIMLKGMVYQGVLVALVAIAQTIPAVQQWWISHYPDLGQYLTTGRATGLFNSPNSAAMIIVPSFIIAIYLTRPLHKATLLRSELRKGAAEGTALTLSLKERESGKASNPLRLGEREWVRWAMMFVLVFGILETRSRGGIIAAVVGLATLYLWHRRRYMWGLVLSIVTLLVVNPVTFSWWALRTPDNMDIRVSIWKKSWELVQNNWLFGIGLGNFQNKFQEYTLHQINYDEFITPYAVHPHNIILYIWLSFGLLGLLGFGYLIFVALRSVSRQKTAWAALGGVLILTMLIHGMIDLTILKNDLIIWFVVALILTRISENREQRTENKVV